MPDDDYRLEIGPIQMHTEGGGIVHPEDAAFATEKVTYYAEVQNNTMQFLGPFEVDLTIDGGTIAYGGMSHQGLQAGQTMWAQGSTDHLAVGNHQLHVTITPGDTLFQGAQQTLDINVLPAHDRRAMHEGTEAGHTGWSQRQVYLTLKDYSGAGFTTQAYVTFSGPGGDVSHQAEVSDGDCTLDNIWVPNEGTLRIAINSGQTQHPTLHGTAGFKVEGESVRVGFIQQHMVHQMNHTDLETWNNHFSTQLHAGADFKIFKFGADVTYEHEWGGSSSDSDTWEVWTPTENLEDEAHASTRNR